MTRDEALALLESRYTRERRRGAEALRDLEDPSAAEAVGAALSREVRDARTWETQYQLVMALGACGDERWSPWLRELAQTPREAWMVSLAIGDALVTIAHRTGRDGAAEGALVWCLDAGETVPLLAEGAVKALAMVPVGLSAPMRTRLLALGIQTATVADNLEDGPLAYWVAVAASDWLEDDPDDRATHDFLHACEASPSKQVRRAAATSLAGEVHELEVL